MVKAVRIALRRQEAQQKLLHIALKDELTGLYNRRAFRALATQGLRVANRLQRSLLLFFADLDDLKASTTALVIAKAMGARAGRCRNQGHFQRQIRYVARIGGDEFIAVAIEEPARRAGAVQALRRSVRARGRGGPLRVVTERWRRAFRPASPARFPSSWARRTSRCIGTSGSGLWPAGITHRTDHGRRFELMNWEVRTENRHEHGRAPGDSGESP